MPFIAIDSAISLRYSGSVSGSTRNMFDFYKEMDKIFSPRGIRSPFHFSKMTSSQKKVCRKEIIDIVNNSDLRFNIFFHPIPQQASHKDYYLFHVPNSIAENLESWIKSLRKGTDIEVIVDDDYNIRKVNNGTDIFIENFLKQIGLRVTGKHIAVYKTHRTDNKVRSTIKTPIGNIVDFFACKSTIKESHEIQIIDIVMGYYIQDSSGFDLKSVHFRRI